MSLSSFRAAEEDDVAGTSPDMSEIDLTLALQLQAQFEEELRVSLLKQEEERKRNAENSPLVLGKVKVIFARYLDFDIPGNPLRVRFVYWQLL